MCEGRSERAGDGHTEDCDEDGCGYGGERGWREGGTVDSAEAGRSECITRVERKGLKRNRMLTCTFLATSLL